MTHESRAGRMRPDTRALADAAEKRGIPWEYLGDLHLRLGEPGAYRRLYRTYTDRTSHLGWVIARDKTLTNRALEEVGLPVPRQAIVLSAEEAVQAGAEFSGSVVVKPRSEDNGVGITVGVSDPADIRLAFDAASAHGAGVIVEERLDGEDFRLLVVGRRLVAAARRDAASVVGDGTRTIRELVDAENRDPRRSPDRQTPLQTIVIDGDLATTLARQGHTLDAIPAAGERVALHAAKNLSLGGTSEDVTDRVHPVVRRIAEKAAETIGLDVAGVDYITPDIARSPDDVGGGICEVNPTPGIRMHLWPSAGEPRDVAGAIIDLLFPGRGPDRDPDLA